MSEEERKIQRERETENPHLDASSASLTIPSNLLLYSINDGWVEETKSTSTAKAAVHSYVYTNIASVCIDQVEKEADKVSILMELRPLEALQQQQQQQKTCVYIRLADRRV
jgi:hypothetical protein